MNEQEIINRTAKYVRETLEGEGSGHDWWHIYRVWKNAITFSKNTTLINLWLRFLLLLHDIADYKFHNNDELKGGRVATEWLQSLNVPQDIIDQIVHIINNISFKGNKGASNIQSQEGFIVQDADRLDAIGAIGIARCFAYGGHKGVELYNPEIPFRENVSKEQYIKVAQPSLNHFYEKLLLLKDLMNTEAGKKAATERHAFMVSFLDEFYKEWDGEK